MHGFGVPCLTLFNLTLLWLTLRYLALLCHVFPYVAIHCFTLHCHVLLSLPMSYPCLALPRLAVRCRDFPLPSHSLPYRALPCIDVIRWSVKSHRFSLSVRVLRTFDSRLHGASINRILKQQTMLLHRRTYGRTTVTPVRHYLWSAREFRFIIARPG